MPLISIYDRKPPTEGEGWKVFGRFEKGGLKPLSTYHYAHEAHVPEVKRGIWHQAVNAEICDERWPDVRYQSGFHILLSPPPDWGHTYQALKVQFQGGRLIGKDNTFVRLIDCIVADEILVEGHT